ncbi:TetR/AcrR family transcriptional regulator [Kutzneria sp. CA-103260]|uniref:TetR/AcrR family transcriptional regulator n=1 Tax=Kutzneria sp. CA-103260 TaxID=2802641 RepID=UPI001BF17EE3|nr:TetR/AcrR family transcriptional regulator [Kutzneria sp. CA-103260]QUQ67569.1 Bacterial regulatory protein, tetR family [Kutzneria sp. CA-103260]
MVGQASGRRPGRPAQISRDRIVEAVASAENVDTLTMRELATRLGVTHGALYRWVKNRDELFDLVSEVLVERIVGAVAARAVPSGDWAARLTAVSWAMHDEFLALPGFATHLSRPHRHSDHSIGVLRSTVVDIFRAAEVDDELAQQSWHIFITCVVGWLASAENPLDVGPGVASFELFLDVLLRGLPARAPGVPRP